MKNTKHAFRLNFSALNGKDSRCNLKCFNCHKDYFDVTHLIDETKSMSFTDAIEFMYQTLGEEIKNFDKIHISGHAEPTMIGRERFIKEVKALREKFLELPIALTTNGTYLKDIRDDFLAISNTYINLSLHHLAYLKTKWFNQLCTLDEEKRKRVELNIIIDPEIIENFKEIFSFLINHKISAKFFHRLEENQPQKVISDFIDFIRQNVYTFNINEYSDEKRYNFVINNEFTISIKLPVDLARRPQACLVCPMLKNCIESCWTSVRITPWYIKPCGMREDNVYLFSENSKLSLKEKLASGGKI